MAAFSHHQRQLNAYEFILLPLNATVAVPLCTELPLAVALWLDVRRCSEQWCGLFSVTVALLGGLYKIKGCCGTPPSLVMLQSLYHKSIFTWVNFFSVPGHWRLSKCPPMSDCVPTAIVNVLAEKGKLLAKKLRGYPEQNKLVYIAFISYIYHLSFNVSDYELKVILSSCILYIMQKGREFRVKQAQGSQKSFRFPKQFGTHQTFLRQEESTYSLLSYMYTTNK